MGTTRRAGAGGCCNGGKLLSSCSASWLVDSSTAEHYLRLSILRLHVAEQLDLVPFVVL